MFVENKHVSEHLQSILPDCDLVVGTEEELCIAGGSQNVHQSLENIRSLTAGAIVRKRGAQGSMVYPDKIPEDLEAGVSAAPFAVEVLNSTGAGDGFLAGFLLGWIRKEDWKTCCRFGNACGAMVVSRHACSAAMPGLDELNYFLTSTTHPARLWEDMKLEQLHWATRRKHDWPELEILAFDHRTQFEDLAQRFGRSNSHIRAAKRLVGHAWRAVADGNNRVGAIIDEQYGGDLLEQLTGSGRWLARPIEQAGVTPLKFEGGPNVGLSIKAWPQEHVVKCLVRYDLECRPEIRAAQDARLRELFQACRVLARELLLEVLPTPDSDPARFEIATVVRHLYENGIFPDWWKIECPPRNGEWQDLSAVIADHDVECRGVVVLGKGVPLEELCGLFKTARRYKVCKGFAVGRSIFHVPIETWFAGTCSDDECTRQIEKNFRLLIEAWARLAP
jgi:5-dehydro-2-deoxygluconokinase